MQPECQVPNAECHPSREGRGCKNIGKEGPGHTPKCKASAVTPNGAQRLIRGLSRKESGDLQLEACLRRSFACRSCVHWVSTPPAGSST